MEPTTPTRVPSAKVVFATVGALVSAAVVVIGANGWPATALDWLKTIGAVLAIAAGAGAAGYAKVETRPTVAGG